MMPNTQQKTSHENEFISVALSKPLEACVVPETMVEPTIEWNHYRRAKAELSLYLVMNSEPYHQSTQSELCESTPKPNYYEESEDSMSFGDDIPPHLDNPRPLPLMQHLRNWWR